MTFEEAPRSIGRAACDEDNDNVDREVLDTPETSTELVFKGAVPHEDDDDDDDEEEEDAVDEAAFDADADADDADDADNVIISSFS